MQSKESLTQPTFCKVEFKAKASYFKVLACAEMPLCVVVSTVPFPPGEEIPMTVIVQLIEAFAYSCESDCVEILLQREHLENPKHKAYFLTLCVVADSTRLEALRTSIQLRDVIIDQAARTTLPSWTHCNDGPPATRPWLSCDASLIHMLAGKHELVTAATSQAASSQAAWSTHAVRESRTFIVVEVLLPRPFPSADKASLGVTYSAGDTMKITIKAVPEKNSQKIKALDSRKVASAKGSRAADHEDGGIMRNSFVFPKQHIIPLPAAISSSGYIVKLSRQLGILVV
jgi:hypothetical protein